MSWKEIYRTNDYKQFKNQLKLLKNSNMIYKTKILDLSEPTITLGFPCYRNYSPPRYMYYIYIKRTLKGL